MDTYIRRDMPKLLKVYNDRLFSKVLPLRDGFVKWKRHADYLSPNSKKTGATLALRVNGEPRIVGIRMFLKLAGTTEGYAATLLHECIHAFQLLQGVYSIDSSNEEAHGTQFIKEVERCVNKMKNVKLPHPFSTITLQTQDVLGTW